MLSASQQSKITKPTPLSRSQTTPDLSIQTVADKDLSEEENAPTSPSICRSPSWSHYRRDKQKKAKEQKEADKPKNGAIKEGKRLSKKPPAAMETQRMSAALRTSTTNSPTSPSTSHAYSGRSSSEDRRSSITSIGSLMDHMRPSSRRSTQSRQLSPVGNEKKVYDGGVAELAYQVNKSATNKGDPSPKSSQESQPISSKRLQHPDTPPSSRSSLEPVPSTASQTQSTPDNVANRKQGSAEKKDNQSCNVGQYYVSGNNKHDVNGIHQPALNPSLVASSGNLPKSSSSHYGDNSYVFKQRLHHQQRSIDGYKDELAVGEFVRPFDFPPTPKDSAESVANSQKTVVADKEDRAKEAVEEDDPLDDTFSWHNASLAEEALLVSKKRTREPMPSKINKSIGPLEKWQLRDVLTPQSTDDIGQFTSMISPTPVAPQSKGVQELKETRAVRRKSTNASTPKYVIQPEKIASQAIIEEAVPDDDSSRLQSLHRHRSDPELLSKADANNLPSLDFLPELKHQPLVKPKRESLTRASAIRASTDTAVIPSMSQFPVRASKMDFSPPTSPSAMQTVARPNPIPPFPSKLPTLEKEGSSKRSSSAIPSPLRLSPSPSPSSEALSPKPMAKMFVICCRCKYWHDMPSKLYEAMAIPRKINDGDKIAKSIGARRWSDSGKERERSKGKEGMEGKVYTEVSCPWCAHGMSTACCAGWTAVVYLHERHH